MITLAQLVWRTDPEKVVQDIMTFYEGEEGNIFGYLRVLEKLKLMQVGDNTDGMHICVGYVEKVTDIKGDSDYFSVYGRSEQTPPDEEWYGIGGWQTRWAIEYRPWHELLGMPIMLDHPMTENLKDSEILALILWEMTFAGFDEDEIKSQWDEIMSAKKEVDEAIASGDDSKFVSCDDVFAALEGTDDEEV